MFCCSRQTVAKKAPDSRMSRDSELSRRVIVGRTKEQVISELKTVIETCCQQAITSKPDATFRIGLSGGSLINFLCQCLPEISTDWSKWRFFFCDERLMAFDDEESTYGCYKRQLLGKIPISEDNFIPIDPNLTVFDAAVDYTNKLKSHFGCDQLPQFDLLLLGIGPDGHTCSLFPGHKLLQEKDQWVSGIDDSPKPPPCRITLTLPVLNNAKCVAFVATGSGKAETLKQIFNDTATDPLPAARIKPTNGDLVWILDEDAAKLVQPTNP